jgi:hypothetical protein
VLSGSAVCKDCGNGTLNNKLNERFVESEDLGYPVVVCAICGSSHIDGELYNSEEE